MKLLSHDCFLVPTLLQQFFKPTIQSKHSPKKLYTYHQRALLPISRKLYSHITQFNSTTIFVKLDTENSRKTTSAQTETKLLSPTYPSPYNDSTLITRNLLDK